ANDINSNYNMADAVFTACFLNSCLRHCDVVGMANFSPVVNTVGAIFTHADGIVLRPTYHVFDLFANHTYDEIVHSVLASPSFEVASEEDSATSVPQLDAVATRDSATGRMGITLVNLHGADAITCRIRGLGASAFADATTRTVNGDAVDSYNDVDQPEAVSIFTAELTLDDSSDFSVECPAHSVTVLNLNAG
ncbi:MAG: alpha-N-arabinofuranosidase, partial [Chloroflexi bacterium]|nr:alpha-N-arabinofuranosidase [Chloroflexota bacterium]